MTIFKLNKNALYALLLSVMALGMMAACSSSEESSDSTSEQSSSDSSDSSGSGCGDPDACPAGDLQCREAAIQDCDF